MRLVAEYKMTHGKIHAKKRIKMIVKRLAELKKQSCIIKNIPPHHLNDSDFFLHVRVYETSKSNDV
jgi:hypothetical protein